MEKSQSLSKLLEYFLYFISSIVVVTILYNQFKNENKYYANLFIVFVILLFVWYISHFSKGQKWDKIFTMMIWLIFFSSVYISYSFIDSLNLSSNNPFVILFISVQIFMFSLLLVSRYTNLNLVKVISWSIGLFCVLMFFFTFGIWDSIKVCQAEQGVGLQDSGYITLGVYTAWAIIIVLLFVAEQMGNVGKRTTQIIMTLVAVGMTIYLLGYTMERCEPAEKEIKKETDEKKAEMIAETKEVTWINNSIHLITLMAYFSLFTGHIYSSLWYSFAGYYMLDGCSPKEDSRRVAVSASFLLGLIGLGVKAISGILG